MKYIHLPLTYVALLLMCLLLGVVNESNAQTINGTTYPFSNTSGAVLEVPTGAVQLIGSGSDNVASVVTNIGFDFWFTGTRFTQFSVNENGLMKLGNVAITNEFANSMTSATNLPKIAPYWDDLATGTTGNVQYWVTGTAPNRKLVVQWNVTVPKAAASPANSTFQAWLYESTGVIEFVYGSGLVTNSNNYSIGVGNSSSLFASVNTAFPFANYGTANDANTLALTNGTKYTFTPLVPPAPTALTFPIVNSGSMTVSWTNPGVTSAVGYVVYNSIDNINFNYVTQVASGSNSVAISGLNPATLYYFKILAVSEGGLSSALAGSQSTNSTPVTGTKTIGTSGSPNYTSITAAIADIQTNGLSGSVFLELQPDYTTAGETFPITFTGLVTSAVNTLTIRPAASVSSLSISPANTFTQTIVLNGASYITIDGRPGGTGTTKALTISNSSAACTGTIFLQNDAVHNLIEYCNLTSITTLSTGGVIGFSTTTGTLGNSNNTIDNCFITDGGSLAIYNAIYSAGTVGKENKLNIISNNNISNFFNGGATASAIALSTGNTDWTITGNSFYQTVSRTSNQSQMVLNITSGTNYFITGNYFGGSAPLAAGTPWTTGGAVSALGLTIINVSSVGSTITVSNNTITNFSLTATLGFSGGVTAITAFGATVTVTNNIIGSNTPGTAISVSTSGSNGSFTGINAGATVSGNVSNNNILGITSGGTANPPIYAISTSGAAPTFTINANTIGSLGSANTISGATFYAIQNAATGTVNITNNAIANSNISSSTIGIYNTAGAATISGNSIYSNTGASLTGISNVGTGAVTITNNVVYNDVLTSSITGISASAGTNTITLNTIKDLSGTATSITGISSTATLAGQTVSQNIIDSLISTSAGAPVLRGIYYSGPVTGTNLVSRNFIHSFDCTVGALTSVITGIYDNAGTTTYQNNMIRLGIKPDGTSITIGLSIIGINQVGGTADKFYFNSVYIGGSGVATGTAANTTFAFIRGTNTTLCDVRNNIFVNARSNGAGLGKHYVLKITSTTDYTTPNLTLNNNIYYGTGTGSVFGLVNTNDYTFPAWKGLTNFDVASPFADPNYITPTGNSSLVSLNVQNPTPAEGNGVLIPSVTDDYSGQIRASLTPTDIGANAGNFGSVLDVLPPVITYTALLNAGTTGNRILTATITDQTGVPVTGSLQPRIYFKKMFAGAWFSTQGALATGNGTNGTWNFTINTATLGGVIAGTDSVYYYVIAQDQVGTPNIGSSPSGAVATDVNTVTTQPANPNKYKVLLGLSGVVTVGAGGNYTSLTLAGGLFSALSTAVLTANVTVNITSDLTVETGAVTLGPILNDGSGIYTVTINPVGARTISGTGVSPALITVNGANGFIIDGLNSGGNSLVIANSGSYPAVMYQSGASNNILRNTTVKSASTGGAVISFGSSSASQGCNNNNINNCIITSTTSAPAAFPAYGLYFYGNSTTILASGNIIDHCTITNFTNTGIYCYYYYSAYTISNNEIYNAFPAGTSLTGIYFSNYYASGITNVFNNKIHDLNPASTTSTGSIYGINYYQGSSSGPKETINIYNNLVYLDATVSNTALSTLYGIDMNGNGTSNVYYNSIYIGGTGVTAGSSAGLAFVGNYSGPDNFMNNAVFNARSGGVGPHYGINCSELYGTFVSNYNNIFANGIGSMFGNYKGTNYQTLSAWSAACGQDLGSFSGNPGFTSATNLTPNVADPNTFNLNGNGLPIAAVAVDYSGSARSVLVSSGPSDIGAFEFTPAATPNAAAQFGNIQVGNTTAYFIGGKLAGTIQWTGGTALPTSVSFKYWAGIAPPTIPNLKYGSGYFEVVQTGGTNYTYNITLNYSAATINTISSESNITLSKKDGSTWTAYTTTLDTVNKKVTINGLNLLSLFALIDKSSIFTNANLKVFLEGTYNAGTMAATLNTQHVIPLTSDSAYSGVTYGYTPRTVVSIPNVNVVDWILVELRTGIAASTKIFTTTGFLLNNGSIVDIDGVSPLSLTSIAPGNYYVVLRHRNHLAVMSASAIPLNGSSPLYDFTTGQAQAFGTNPLADLTGGIFGMYTGDANNDGQITSTDFNIYNPKFFSAVTGYDISDWNMDGQVTSSDFNFFNVNFYNARTTQVPF